MARISRRSIDELRQRADIVALAGDYTQMKQRGRDWWGLSPFKSEKSPSFKVNPETGLWYCFSTQQGGDAFKLVMNREGLDFPESVERVANRFGFKLDYESGGDGKNEKSFRGQLLEIHELVADYWRRCFLEDPVHGEWIRDYWTRQRKFTPEVADDFGIGFAPLDDSKLIPGLLAKGYAKDALAQTGLFFGVDRVPDPLRWRCRFRGRLIIPIRDIQGRVIAFTARQLDITPQDDPSREAKYVNSPETELFKKSRTVFNLDRARSNRKGDEPFILVEGQLDAIRCHSAGIPGVIAAQGTAVTEDHLQQLHRFSQRLLVFLDADAAGQKAALRLLPIGLREGLVGLPHMQRIGVGGLTAESVVRRLVEQFDEGRLDPRGPCAHFGGFRTTAENFGAANRGLERAVELGGGGQGEEDGQQAHGRGGGRETIAAGPR